MADADAAADVVPLFLLVANDDDVDDDGVFFVDVDDQCLFFVPVDFATLAFLVDFAMVVSVLAIVIFCYPGRFVFVGPL